MFIKDQKLREQVPNSLGLQSLARLRWKFIFHEKNARIGVWNGATNRFEDSAASINKTGLLVAQIQVEVIGHWTTQIVYECDGHDYVSARWIAATKGGNALAKWNQNSYKLSPTIVGLAFITRKERVCVFADGRIDRRKNTDYELKFKLREHKEV